jgi:hypothetical protein
MLEKASEEALGMATTATTQTEVWPIDKLVFYARNPRKNDAAVDRRSRDVERANTAPPVPEHPVSQSGDLWLCGEHRVLCGDATRREDVERRGAERHVRLHIRVGRAPWYRCGPSLTE